MIKPNDFISGMLLVAVFFVIAPLAICLLGALGAFQ
jgi:hypothetical protein